MEIKRGVHTYILLLRGINVGGHKKVPMAQLRSEMEKIGCSDVTTLLNSGNAIFNAAKTDPADLQERIAVHLQEVFGFEVPTHITEADILKQEFSEDPFGEEEVTENTRFYITFLPTGYQEIEPVPFQTADGSFRIIRQKNGILCSVIDLNRTGTVDAMGLLDRMYGKGITTRNWNTVQKILKKLG